MSSGLFPISPEDCGEITLDDEYEPLKNKYGQNKNRYVMGQVNQHNMVIACVPAGVY